MFNNLYYHISLKSIFCSILFNFFIKLEYFLTYLFENRLIFLIVLISKYNPSWLIIRKIYPDKLVWIINVLQFTVIANGGKLISCWNVLEV